MSKKKRGMNAAEALMAVADADPTKAPAPVSLGPLPGAPLESVERPQSIPTPFGAMTRFDTADGYELSLDGSTVHVRCLMWHAGFSSVGCHWVFAL